MKNIYKRTESFPILKHKRVHSELENNEATKCCEEQNTFVSLTDFIEFVDSFHNGVQNKSTVMIFTLLCQFFSEISYVDQNSVLLLKVLSDESLYYLKENSEIINDIIYCFQLSTNTEFILALFELCDYLFYSDFFVNEFLVKDGLNYIISGFNQFKNEELLLKSIIILVNFSKCNKSHQKLIDPEFTKKFYAFCNSLFIQKKLKNFNEIACNTIILLRQIVGILTEQDEQIEQQPLGLAQNQQQKSINVYDFSEIYKLLGYFFYSNYPEVQKEAIKTLYMFYSDQYFINEIFPSILNYIPNMELQISSNPNSELILKNKIKLYKLISLVYSNDDDEEDKETFEQKSYYIKQFIIPFDTLINSLSSDNNKEVIASFDVFHALFHYDIISIEIAFQKELYNVFMEMIDCAPFDIKEQALIAISTWITCTNNDDYKEPFIDLDFVDLLFDLIEGPEENLKNAAKDIIILLKYSSNNNDDYFKIFIDERFELIDENSNDD